MKKLLSILSVVTLSVSTLSSVIACGNPTSNNRDQLIENRGQDMKLTADLNTSYKTREDIAKQEMDGRPLGKYWMPEGVSEQGATEGWYPHIEGNQKGLFNFYDYDLSKDKDAKYNRATVKLKERTNTLGSNEFQDKTGKVKNIAMGVMNRTTSGTAAQGNSIFANYNFTNWQYVDIYAAWAGSNGEGIIVLPTPDLVDAAHINGTQVLGMIYFDGYWGLQDHPEYIKKFFQKDEQGHYKVVDKLIEVANYYGFDGWFWNDEANATKPIIDEDDVIGVMKEYQEKVKQQQLDLLMVSYSNQTYLAHGAKMDLAEKFLANSDYFVQDYGPWAEETAQWFKKHPEYQGKEFNVSAMPNLGEWYTSGDEFAEEDLTDYFGKTEGGKINPLTSFSIFALADTLKWGERDAMYGKPLNINHYFRQHEQKVYSGLAMDPSFAGEEGHGLANYLLEKSTYHDSEFLTNFSTGQGTNFFIDGQKVKTNADWNMRGVSDQVATYQWIVDNEEGNDLVADYDYSVAWQKGNSIALKSSNWNDESSKYSGGKLAKDQKTTIDLLGTKIKIEDQKIAMKILATGKDNEDLLKTKELDVKFKLTFAEDTDSKIIEADIEMANNVGWYTAEVDLTESNAKTLKDVSLEFSSKNDKEDVSINIGEISLLKNTSKTLTNLENFKIEYVIDKDSTTKNLRVYWDKKENNDYDRYEFYQENENGQRIFLGTTRTNAYFLENFEKKNGSKLIVSVVSNLDSSQNLEKTFEL